MNPLRANGSVGTSISGVSYNWLNVEVLCTVILRDLVARWLILVEVMFSIKATDVLDIFADVPSHDIALNSFSGEGLSLTELVVACGVAPSKGAARRLIESGGIYINNRRIADIQTTLNTSTLIEGEYLVLRKGARDYHLVRAI